MRFEVLCLSFAFIAIAKATNSMYLAPSARYGLPAISNGVGDLGQAYYTVINRAPLPYTYPQVAPVEKAVVAAASPTVIPADNSAYKYPLNLDPQVAYTIVYENGSPYLVAADSGALGTGLYSGASRYGVAPATGMAGKYIILLKK